MVPVETAPPPKINKPLALEQIAKDPDFDLLLRNAENYLEQEFKPQPTLEDQILADPDFDKLLENANKLLTQAPIVIPQPKPFELPRISRRRFLVGVAATAGLALGGHAVGELTSGQKPPLPESPSEEITTFNELIRPLIDLRDQRREAWLNLIQSSIIA